MGFLVVLLMVFLGMQILILSGVGANSSRFNPMALLAIGYSLLLALSALRWAPSLVRWRRAILLDLGRVGHMLLSMH